MAKKTLTPAAYATNNIQNQADQVKGQAPALKLAFDQTGIDAKSYTNTSLITELQSETPNDAGSNAVGSEGTFGTNNVGDELKAVKVITDNLDVKDGQNVKLTGNQTVAGTKTFSSNVVVPLTPTLDAHAVSKKYVDDQSPLTIPNDSLTELKMAPEMKKQSGGVATYEMGLTPKQLGGGYLINGDFSIWEKGTNFLGISNEYTANRKKVFTSFGTTDVTRVSPVIEGFKYAMRVETDVIESGIVYIREEIEDFEIFNGKDAIFKAGVLIDNGLTATIRVLRNDIQVSQISVVGDGSIKTLELPINLSIGITSLKCDILFNKSGLGIGEGITIQYVKLELGNISTNFIRKPYYEELRDCLRYNERLIGNNNAAYGHAVAVTTSVASLIIPKAVSSRIRIPTLITNGSFNLIGSNTIPVTSIVVAGTLDSDKFVALSILTAGGMTIGNSYRFVTADDLTAFIELDYEM